MLQSLLQLQSSERKVILLSALGGALEFYDFIIYVFFASYLSQLFFPAKNHLASLMGAFAVFAIGYLIRPLGGLIFSHFGDKYGRKKTFVVSLLLMALPTFAIGLLPTHDMLGIVATLLLIALRILQGLSIGGEIPGAITFAGEHVNPQYRGLTCAIIFFGINIGITLGSAVSVLLVSLFSEQQLLAWGWRVPFILGGLLGIVSFYLRKQMTETPIFSAYQYEIKQRSTVPILYVLRHYPLLVLQGIGISCLGAVVISVLFLYLPVYLADILHYPRDRMDQLNTINVLVFSCLLVVTGWLSDKVGRSKILLFGSLGLGVLSYGLFYLFAQQHIGYVILVMLAFSLLSACITGVFPCALIELFPTSVRYTGMAVSYNMSFAIFGGMAPLVATYLIKTTGNVLAPSFCLIVGALLCFIATLKLQSRHKISLSMIGQ